MQLSERKVLDRMFEPRGVAVFGGVHEPGKFGHMMLQSLIRYGFKGRIYPVSPSGGEVFGLRVFRNLREVDEEVDLACVCVPAKEVASVLRDCLEKGVKGAEVLSSGFAETGEWEGISLQEEIVEIAARGIRIVGPNCFGIHCPKSGLTLLPGFDFSRVPGEVGFISQSGGIATDLCHDARAAGFGFSKVVSYGNGCDLEACSLLEFLSEDQDTRFIGAYLEGVKDGRRMIEILKAITPKKQVVVWKGGLTPAGAAAVRSHTGSMAGERDVWRGIFAQSGVLSVEGLEELTDTLAALTHLKKRGRRIALLGGGGAIGVYCSDLAYRYGLELPAFSEKTVSALRRWFPSPGISLKNPLDTGTPVIRPDVLGSILECIMREERFDALVVVLLIHPLAVVSPQFMAMDGLPAMDLREMVSPLLEGAEGLRKMYGKDIVVVMENRAVLAEEVEVEGQCRSLKALFLERGVPVFTSVKRALVAIAKAAQRSA